MAGKQNANLFAIFERFKIIFQLAVFMSKASSIYYYVASSKEFWRPSLHFSLLVLVIPTRHDKVEKGPQFVQVVLEGGAGQKKAVGAAVGFQLRHQLAICVLQPVTLINNDVFPRDPSITACVATK